MLSVFLITLNEPANLKVEPQHIIFILFSNSFLSEIPSKIYYLSWIKRIFNVKEMLDPNFVRGWSFAKVLTLASRIEMLDTNCRAIQKVFQRFRKEYGKYPKGRAKGSFGGFFILLVRPS